VIPVPIQAPTVVHVLLLIAVAIGVTLAVTPIVRRVSVRADFMDRPGARKVHTTAVPRLGGIGIMSGFAAALLVETAGELWLGWPGVLLLGDGQVLGTVVGVAVIFVVGLIDDFRGMKARTKFAGQLLAAVVTISFGLKIDFFSNPFGGGRLMLDWLSYPLTALWLVGFANVFNLIDGLDGLAAGIAAIAAASFLALAMDMNQAIAAVLAASLIGGCVGFLRYNFNPASIYMGDSGALSIGFALGCVSLTGVMKSAAAISLVAPLLIIGVPLFDTASAIIRRRRHGRPIHEADNGHIHHRLLHRGFSQRQTVLLIYAWSAALAVGGYAMRDEVLPSPLARLGVLAFMLGLSAFLANRLGLFDAARVHGDGVNPRD
jgi:UDP-GlcNAc:undecaprenyl-phosphate/decaprenyl-phosphate GlcNAc-1-phosphate transferase